VWQAWPLDHRSAIQALADLEVVPFATAPIL
jgi:hypothetical protein